jgi:hypothetical protein
MDMVFDGGRVARRRKEVPVWPVRQVPERELEAGRRAGGRNLPDIEPYSSSLLTVRFSRTRWLWPDWAWEATAPEDCPRRAA